MLCGRVLRFRECKWRTLVSAALEGRRPKVHPMLPSSTMDSQWYLVRTKPSRERYVSAQLARLTPEVFLPLVSTAGRPTDPNHHAAPLFPQYIFLRCDLTANYFQIRYAPGVTSFVTAGLHPLSVPESIIESIRARCTNDVVHLSQKPFRKGEPVQFRTGPFRGFEAVFERYLSGAERVAILLNAMDGYSLRVITPARSIAR
jgi:transcriptional antiterminator RfaH